MDIFFNWLCREVGNASILHSQSISFISFARLPMEVRLRNSFDFWIRFVFLLHFVNVFVPAINCNVNVHDDPCELIESFSLIGFSFVRNLAGIPKTLTWWALLVGQFVITAAFGEWLCVREELKSIAIKPGQLASLNNIAVQV